MWPVSRMAALLLLGASLWSRSALAQAAADPAPPPGPAPAPLLTPPIVQSNTDVPYPRGAQGDAVVLLELTVGKDGTVSAAEVVEGLEPFADQARRAVLAWHFTPALRRGVPVAARIRARVRFHQEASPVAPAPNSMPAGEPFAPPGPATPQTTMEPAEEVSVYGRRKEIGRPRSRPPRFARCLAPSAIRSARSRRFLA